MIEAIDSQPSTQSHDADDFVSFVRAVEPRLRRALAGAVGLDRAHDAVAEALAWAWENWADVQSLQNPAGYLYRVAQSRLRVRTPKRIRYLTVEPSTMPDIEPALPSALRALPTRQRAVVWLVYACEWSYAEVADALEISTSAVGTHASRGLAALRKSIGDRNG